MLICCRRFDSDSRESREPRGRDCGSLALDYFDCLVGLPTPPALLQFGHCLVRAFGFLCKLIQLSTGRDTTGHKHPIHGAVCGHSALALRVPAYEEKISLNKKSAQKYHLRAPSGFALDYTHDYIRRDFVSDFGFSCL